MMFLCFRLRGFCLFQLELVCRFGRSTIGLFVPLVAEAAALHRNKAAILDTEYTISILRKMIVVRDHNQRLLVFFTDFLDQIHDLA